MHKLYSALTGLCLSVLALGSQSALAQTLPTHRTCGTQDADAMQQAELVRQNPGYNPVKMAGVDPSIYRTTATSYTMPVIVHVINNGEAVGTGTNITHAQIQSQIDVLNEDYHKMNADGVLVPTAFQPVRADMQFQFVAANVNPSGVAMAEPGVDRISRVAKGWTAPPYTQAYIDATIKPATSWDPTKYINVWVMNLGGGLLGYAQFPNNTANLGGLSASGGSAGTDGVVILYTAFGRTGVAASPYNKGRSLTHELGHFFSLRHVWGDSNCGTDYCNDTPTQQTSNYGCPTYPHLTCSNTTTGDMFMNYMDYVDDGCMEMFSADQMARMQAIMSVATPRRATLPAAVATVYQANATITNPGVVCVGGSITLTANGPAGATYAWTGPSGFSSALQTITLPNVTAAMAGAYSVTVTAGTTSSSIVNTTLVVNPAPVKPTLVASPTSVCVGSASVLSMRNASALTSTPVYSWTLVSGDGLPAVTNTATISATPTVASVYRLTINYAGSTCTSTSTVSVGIGLAPTSASNSGTACVGGTVTLTTPTVAGAVYSWTGPNSFTSTQQNPVLANATAAMAGVYIVTISIPNSTCGNTSDANTTVTVTSPPPTPVLAASSAAVCAGSTSVLSMSNAGTLTSTPTYAWTLVSGDGLPTATSAATLTVTPSMASVYRLTINYAGSTCTSTSTVSVGVSPLPPVPALATTATSVCSTCPATSAVLSASNLASTTPTPVYSWALVSGNGLPAATNTATLTVTPTVASTYSLTINYPGSTCTTTSTISISMGTALATVKAANGYSIVALPVPFTSEGVSLQVTTPKAGPLTVKLYDVLGRAVYTQAVANVKSGTSTITLPGTGLLAPARYVMVVTQGDQESHLNIVRAAE